MRHEGDIDCEDCDGDGYVCVLCESPESDCECWDDFEYDDDLEVRRCHCNPRQKANVTGPS